MPYIVRVSDRRGYTLRPGFSDEKRTINELGFRGPAVLNQPSRPLICVLGDSVPFGAGASDHETFPHHLQRHLAPLGFQVLNGGVPSYNLRQSIDRWKTEIRPRWECAAFVLSAANDVSLIHHYGSQYTPDATWAQDRFGIAVARWSSAFYYGERALRRVFPERSTLSQERALDLLRKDFFESLAELEAQGRPIVLMPINACHYRDRPIDDRGNAIGCAGSVTYKQVAEVWSNSVSAVNEMLQESATSNLVSYLDTVAAFDKELGRDGMFVDFIHYTDRGARAVARLLAEHLAEVLPEMPTRPRALEE